MEMPKSILTTVKKLTGAGETYDAFDVDIIVAINSVFLTLNQLGVGPDTPFQITGEGENWEDFIDTERFPGIQSYISLRVRMTFDPPTTSFVADNFKRQIDELEWRLCQQAAEYRRTEEAVQAAEYRRTEEAVQAASVRMSSTEAYLRSVFSQRKSSIRR